jgi:hypothetical protein
MIIKTKATYSFKGRTHIALCGFFDIAVEQYIVPLE